MLSIKDVQLVFLACAAAALPARALAQNCLPFWTGAAAQGGFRSLQVFDDGSGLALYATGSYAYPRPWHGVARWNGHTWIYLHKGWPPHVPALSGCNFARLVVLDFGDGPRLCAFARVAPSPCTRLLLIWTGSRWVDAPAGLLLPNPYSQVDFLPIISISEPSGPRIYSVYLESQTGGSSIVRWNGSSWDSIGEFWGTAGTGSEVLLVEYDDGNGPRLHVRGAQVIGGVAVNGIGRWNGAAWEPLGSGICGSYWPRDMIVHDDGTGPKLYVADVHCAGGQPVNRIAKWDGKNWSDVGGGGINTVGITAVHTLGSFDDGRGPALYAGGYITMAGGVPVNSLARYNGTQWDDVMGGVGGGIPLDFAVFDDGRGPSLFVAGEFNRAGAGAPGSTPSLAQIVGCPNCYANCDNSTTAPRLNIADFACFIGKFAQGDPYIDCNQDRARDVADFACFLQKFAAGCP